MSKWMQVLIYKDGTRSTPDDHIRHYKGLPDNAWETVLSLPDLVVVQWVEPGGRHDLWITVRVE